MLDSARIRNLIKLIETRNSLLAEIERIEMAVSDAWVEGASAEAPQKHHRRKGPVKKSGSEAR